MTFPCVLSLVKNNGSYVLESRPIKEIAKLHTKSVTIKPLQITGMKNITSSVPFALSPMEMNITFHVVTKTENRFGIQFSPTSPNVFGTTLTKVPATIDETPKQK
jgi:2-hydroxychromene-2-carboxylate isomerase